MFEAYPRAVSLIIAVVFVATVSQRVTGAGAAALMVSVQKKPSGIEVSLTSTVPLRFALQHLKNPDRVVVGLRDAQITRLSGAQVVDLPPVQAIRLAREAGFVQVVIDLTEPVVADAEVSRDGRRLILLLHSRTSGQRQQAPAEARAPPAVVVTTAPRLPTEAIRLRHSTATEIAGHLQRLLPGLVVRAALASNSLLLSGPSEQIARAKLLVAALDVPPSSAPVTEAIIVKALQAEALASLLLAMFPEARVKTETRFNAVVVAALPRVLEQIKAVIATLDVPPTPSPTEPITEVFRLQHADPMKTAALLLAALPGAKVRVDHASRTIAITAPPQVLTQARTLIQKLDVSSPTAPVSEVVRVRSVDPEAVANVLRQAVKGITVTPDKAVGAVILVGPRELVERAKAIVASLDASSQPGPAQLRVEVIPIKYAIPSEFVTETATSRTAEEMAQTVLSALQPVYPELRIAVDKRGQHLIATGSPPAISAVRDLVAKLDLLSPQVALEVKVVEVAANALSNIGISLSPIIGSTYTEGSPNVTPFFFGRTPINITVILNTLAEQGKAKILANPTIATMDGRRALIRTGDDIPLVIRQIFGNTVLENVVTFRAGVTLEIIPKISPDGLITVILKPTVSTITGTTPQGAPQISVREVQTMLTVRDGETIVIGGLLEERDIISMTKIPFLGDLPVLGRLFRSERRDHRRTELVITVTPRILKPSPAPPSPPEPSDP